MIPSGGWNIGLFLKPIQDFRVPQTEISLESSLK